MIGTLNILLLMFLEIMKLLNIPDRISKWNQNAPGLAMICIVYNNSNSFLWKEVFNKIFNKLPVPLGLVMICIVVAYRASLMSCSHQEGKPCDLRWISSHNVFGVCETCNSWHIKLTMSTFSRPAVLDRVNELLLSLTVKNGK